jgi:hypothetical protein
MIGRSSSSNDRTDTAVACPQVAKRFLAAVKECSGPGLDMALFISYDPEDIVKQAEQSTLRYQQGTSTNEFFLFSFSFISNCSISTSSSSCWCSSTTNTSPFFSV